MTSVRFVVASKSYHPDAGLLARCRAFYWAIIRRHPTELCGLCGRPVRLVFHVPDALWEKITVHGRSPGGEAAPGVLCPVCVDNLYEAATPRGPGGFLRWTCRLDDSVMRG